MGTRSHPIDNKKAAPKDGWKLLTFLQSQKSRIHWSFQKDHHGGGLSLPGIAPGYPLTRALLTVLFGDFATR